jgi:hypothetical protein
MRRFALQRSCFGHQPPLSLVSCRTTCRLAHAASATIAAGTLPSILLTATVGRLPPRHWQTSWAGGGITLVCLAA